MHSLPPLFPLSGATVSSRPGVSKPEVSVSGDGPPQQLPSQRNLKKALALPPEARAAIAGSLLESLNDPPSDERAHRSVCLRFFPSDFPLIAETVPGVPIPRKGDMTKGFPRRKMDALAECPATSGQVPFGTRMEVI